MSVMSLPAEIARDAVNEVLNKIERPLRVAKRCGAKSVNVDDLLEAIADLRPKSSPKH